MHAISVQSSSLYSKCLLSRRVTLPFMTLGRGDAVKDILLRHVQEQIENKCTIEGFVHPNTCKMITFSGGIVAGSNVKFDVAFECDVCSPAEGATISCVVKNVTHAGIRAVIDAKVTPVVIYVSRDHHYSDDYFDSIKTDDKIVVRVIGQRFELHDKHVSIIGELIKPESAVAAIIAGTAAAGAAGAGSGAAGSGSGAIALKKKGAIASAKTAITGTNMDEVD